ncbi:endonuclease/exonuclease/phosphatase family protein [Tamlana agarivorans]|uniref:Endonuclease/exonuclease/phosphatase family protein n=1 Tax=Pseudotamlana agarivorans TaxID=481183 RepID=A0ACC5U4R7_9FLAO|nr:endonuclease/exonuclease/phosphatase family protein [Tamlana agarivorans]MBU2949305.1 endonuclease/exonuclease/phosphatase family protein [Tamlana agarivorans]
MTKLILNLFFIICSVTYGCQSNSDQTMEGEVEVEAEPIPDVPFNGTLKVLTLNTWHEGVSVTGGFNAIVEVIIQSKADVVVLVEIRNYNNVTFSHKIKDELKSRNETFYTFNSGKSAIILSKFPMTSSPNLDTPALSKSIVKLNETTSVAVYGAHLDYTHYACYLPRGYDGITWKKLPSPITDVSKILEQNKASQRDEAIAVFVEDAEKERQNGNLVLLGGDFNEPSHLDWTIATKDLFDHNGTVVPWHNSLTLKNKNYLDAYRVKYPDPVTHPGHTWAAHNTRVELSKLVWTPTADDRDRIDFIYYNKDTRLTLDDVIVVGPKGSIVRGQGVQETSQDEFLLSQIFWPSDHKGVLATFKIN